MARVWMWLWVAWAWAGCSGGASDVQFYDYSVHPLVPAISIDKVTAYQGVEKVLERRNAGGGGVRPPPLIAHRDMMLRIYAAPEDLDTWQPRVVAVVLKVDNPDQPTLVLTDLRLIAGGWDTVLLGTTSNFRVPAERVDTDMELSVSIHEVHRIRYPGEIDPDDPPQRWSAGPDELVVLTSDVLTVHVIPVSYQADGSGRTPDTSIEHMNELKGQLWAMYPVEDVEIVVEEPLLYGGRVTAFGGWDALLGQIATMRANAVVPQNAYYYGLVNPSNDFGSFCGNGCTAGLSGVSANPSDSWARASIGLGFRGRAGDIMMHEVGHAHGREHAPCGVAGDGQYPYINGTLGSEGYDLRTDQLIEPTAAADMMSYCDPIWLSDYTFTALFERVAVLRSGRRSGPDLDWQLVTVDGDGVGTLRGQLPASADPGGESVQVELTGATGEVVEVTEGWFIPFDHADGGMMLIEPVRRTVTGARVRR